MLSLLEDVLGLDDPWYVHQADFDDEANAVTVTLDFVVGSEFACSSCGTDGCTAYDTIVRRWRHVDFFRHRCYLLAHSPRIDCPMCGVRQAVIPWARSRSRVTYTFEEYLLALADELPSFQALGRIVGEHDTRVGRMVKLLKGKPIGRKP